MKSAKQLFIAILLAAMTFAAESSATENAFKGESRFTREGVTYRLNWTARGTTTGTALKESTKVSYSIRIGDFFLHPRTLGGGTFIGCWDVPPAKVQWEPLGNPQLGWMLKLGGYCSGSRTSFKVLLVVPTKRISRGVTNYISSQFNAKAAPIAIWSKDGKRMRVWSSYEQWSRRKNEYKFMVPELREFALGHGGRIVLTCPPLPPDVRTWPSALPSRSFLGDFYAGVYRLDARIMQSALDTYEDASPEALTAYDKTHPLETYRDIDPNALVRHGFPVDRAGLVTLNRHRA